MPEVVDQSTRYTYVEYATWPDEERWELIDGQAYLMTPAPSTEHQRVSMRLGSQIEVFFRGKSCEVFAAPFDVRLPANAAQEDDAVDTVVQPDILVVCEPAKLDDKGCRGTPDWIVEIISPSTASQDQIRKLDLYERHRVPEYWIVDPLNRIITVFVLSNGCYGKPLYVEAKGKLAPRLFPELEVDWELIFPE